MTSEHLEIKFQGNDYLLIGGDVQRGGPIATRDQFRTFAVSHAFLCDNGDVMARGRKIGHLNEIEVVGPAADVQQPTVDDMVAALEDLKGKGWL